MADKGKGKSVVICDHRVLDEVRRVASIDIVAQKITTRIKGTRGQERLASRLKLHVLHITDGSTPACEWFGAHADGPIDSTGRSDTN